MAERVGVGTVVLIAGLVSLISSAAVAIWWERQLDQRLVMRPPVMILDLSALARATDPEALTAVMRAYTQAADRLAEQGVLVLERQRVLAAPRDLVLRETEVPGVP
jgi:hypothetical protein